MEQINRKQFLVSSVFGGAGLFLFPSFFKAQDKMQTQEKGPPLETTLVKEFVGAAHKDPDKVKSMLLEKPDLLNAVNNLGGWDWEDALGAAGHVGDPELAKYLLEKGARMTICVAAMLGKTEIVKSTIQSFPYMKDAVGPHKISLIRHAKAGGENAKEVYDYLRSLGVKEP
ncbi:MAG: hypothetical protein K0S12_253 [Bacteroidetes bacterium]|jgi:hypothetical protein|nr:hypothetical protein [Bacteroidota bacterium]